MGIILGAPNSVVVTRDSANNTYEDRARELVELAKINGWGCDEMPPPKAMNKVDIESSMRVQGVPERIVFTFSPLYKLKETTALKAVNLFMTKPRDAWCLVLAGPKGCGKSTAAARYLWEDTASRTASPPKTQRWWTAAKVSRVSSFNDELEKLMETAVLVIDDLGVEYMDKGGHFSHRLDELIDYRYSNYRKTIITTNLNKKDFNSRYGVRVTDRIREGFKHGGDYKEIDEKSLRV